MREYVLLSIVTSGALLFVLQPAAGGAEAASDVSTICVEAETGLVLSESKADALRPPASMVKMILMLLVAEGLSNGSWNPDKEIRVSEQAQKMGGTQVFLARGETWPLNKLMFAVAVASANDAAYAVAEGLWGSVDGFLQRANERAKELGMVNSQFNSVHGLPPDPGEKPDVTTARDMAILGRWCVTHPEIIHWTSSKEFLPRPGQSTVYNTNKLLWRLNDCDGLKTGYIRASGFCITATAQRNGVRLVAVVMGAKGNNERFRMARGLLDDGFGQVSKVRVMTAGEAVGPPVSVTNSETTQVRLTATGDVWVVARTKDVDRLKFVPQTPDFVQAPISAGVPLGEVRVELDGNTVARTALAAPVNLEVAGWRWKLKETLRKRSSTPTTAGG